MALEIVARAKMLAAGTVAGVAGNDEAHSARLIALVRQLAAENGVDVSHVTFKPIATERLAGPAGGSVRH